MGRLRVLGNVVPYRPQITRFPLPHVRASRYPYNNDISSLRAHLLQHAQRFTLLSRPASHLRSDAPDAFIPPPANCSFLRVCRSVRPLTPLAAHNSRRTFHSHTSSLPSIEDQCPPPHQSLAALPPPTPATPCSIGKPSLKTPSSDEAIPLSEADAVFVARQIAQSDELLRAIVERGLSTRSRQRWFDALWSSLKADTDSARRLDASSSQLNNVSTNCPPDRSIRNEQLFMCAEHTQGSLPSEPSSAQSVDSADSSQLESSQVGNASDPRDKADQIFRALDVNHDGLVAPREFRIWFSTYYLHNHLPTGASRSSVESETFQKSLVLEKRSAPPASIPSEAESASEKSSGTCECSVLQDIAGSGAQTSVERSAPDADGQKGVCSVAAPATHATPSKQALAVDSTPDITPPSSTGPATTANPTCTSATRASWPLLLRVVIRSSIPYLAFGTIDNGLMLCCGEWIDSTIAVRFCLSSMASAGLGNALSCATGVVTGGCIERLCLRSRLVQKYSPVLTPQQALSRGVRNAHIAGSVMGILTGCLIGMFPLLFVKRDVGPKEKDINASRDVTS